MLLRSATTVHPNAWRQAARRALIAAAPRACVIASGPAPSNSVCLTFDDGPDPVTTPKVLDALRANGAHGSFFVVGSRAAKNPEIVRRMVKEGDEIGHHSWTHTHPSRTTAAQLAEETARTQDFLRTAAGVDSALFRPPHGKLSTIKLLRMLAMKQTIVLWSSDPGDQYHPSAESIVSWFINNPPRPGDIILLHDTTPTMAEALPEIIRVVRERGLGFSTIGDWLPQERPRRAPAQLVLL